MQEEWSIDDIKRANKAAGRFFFSRGAMDGFGSRLGSDVFQGPGGIYFVTTEQPPHAPRDATVRHFDPTTGAVRTAGSRGIYGTRAEANRAARKLAEIPPTGKRCRRCALPIAWAATHDATCECGGAVEYDPLGAAD